MVQKTTNTTLQSQRPIVIPSATRNLSSSLHQFVWQVERFLTFVRNDRVYYHGPALLRVEARFKAIYQENAEPDRYTQMPIMDYAL